MSEPLTLPDADKIGFRQQPSQAVDDSKRSIKPVLQRLFGFALLVAIAVVIGFKLFLPTVKSRPTAAIHPFSQNRSLSSATPMMKVTNTPITDQKIGSLLPLILTVSDKSTGTQETDHPIQSITHDLQITQIKKQWAQLTTLVESQKQRYESELKVINDHLIALRKQLAEADDAIQALKTTQPTLPALVHATKRKALQNQKSTGKKMALPSRSKDLSSALKLVSIDHWGDQTFAVLRYQGQLHALRPGSSLFNWTIERITGSGHGVYVVNRRGQRSLLNLK